MLIISLIIMVNMVAFGITIPILPLIQHVYGISSSNVAYVIQIFAFFGIIGAVFWGTLSDKIGRKYAMIIPMFISCIFYYLSSIAYDLTFFLICRAISGFCNGSFAVGFAAAMDVSTKDNKLKNMSILGMSFGVAGISGSAVGAILGSIFHSEADIVAASFHISAVISAVAFILLLFSFRESKKPSVVSAESSNKNIFHQFKEAIFNKRMLFMMLINVSYMAIAINIQIYLGLWLYNIYKLTITQVSLFWVAGAILMICTQVFIRKHDFKITTDVIMTRAILAFSIGIAGLAMSSNIIAVFLSTALIWGSMAFLQSTVSTNISVSGSNDKQGMIFGINMSLSGIGRIIGPFLGSVIMIYHTYNFMWLILAIITFIIFLIACWYYRKAV